MTEPATSSGCCERGDELDLLDDRRVLARAVELAASCVSQTPPDRGDGLDVDDEEVLLETRRAGDDLAGVVEDDRVPVEDELVLAADEVAEREVGARVARPGDEHLLALLGLADVERRRGEVDDELRSREREVGRGRPGLPDVLADRDPDRGLPESEDDEVAALGEVAVLVEHAVVRQEVLAVHALNAPVGAHGTRVREIAVEPGRPDERHDAVRSPRRSPRPTLVRRARTPGGGGGPRVGSRRSRAPGRRRDRHARARASAIPARIFARLPSRSPTTQSTCARASLKVLASQSQTSV